MCSSDLFKVETNEQKKYVYKIAADFVLVDSWGRIVGGRRDFASLEGTSVKFPDRLPLIFNYSLSGLAPGEYRVETTLRDLLGKQSHTTIVDLRVEGP